MRRRRVTDGVPKSGQGSRIVSRETTVVAEAGSRPPAGEIVARMKAEYDAAKLRLALHLRL